MRILIAEDDQVLADGLLRSLRNAGAAVDHVASGSEADAALMTNNEFDLLILDLGLPKLHGLEVLKRLRARGSTLPVLILTAADSVEERVKGLDYGADDYMAKPFSLQELEARVRALTRRGMGGATSQIKHGPLVYDQAGRVATIDGKMVELSARELGNNPFEFFDFQKMLSALKMPTVDGNSESLINAQKKTLETFANASKVLFEGYNALAKKQIEVLNKAISSAKDATSELAKGNPQQSAGKSIELIQESIVEAQNIANDFSKIAEKTAKESFEILNKRLLEGLTEIKKVIEEEGKKASVKN